MTTKGVEMAQKKEFWIAFGINLFFPGGGHLYVGDTNKGVGLLLTYFIAWGLMPFFYFFPNIIVLGVWIYALVNSKAIVDAYNQGIDEKNKSRDEEEAKRITAEQFVSSINKANQLFSAEIISEAEVQAKKQSIISDLQFKTLHDDQDDLLLGLVPLKRNGVITDEELQQIKKMLTIIN